MTSIPNLAREIVATLVHLRETRTGVPSQGHYGYDVIRADYSKTHSDGSSGDPMLAAAQKWLENKLNALVTGENEEADKLASEAPIPDPVAPVEQLHTEPPLGDLPSNEPFHAQVISEPLVAEDPETTEAVK